MRKKAFTLIELLVVIAIIAILAAILFPVFAQAKQAAKKTAGLAQMKQLITATLIYATDYEDALPTWQECLAAQQWNGEPDPCPGTFWDSNRFWDSKIQPYVKNGDPDTGNHNGIWKSPGREYEVGRSVGMNQLIFWDIDSWYSSGSGRCNVQASNNWFSGCYFWLQLSQVEDHVNTMFVADTGTAGRYEPMYFKNGYAEAWVPTYSGYKSYVWGQQWRYDDGANYTWLDGHAKHRKGDEIMPNPNHEPTLSWPTDVQGNMVCNTAKYQASTVRMKQDLITRALNNYGVTCSQ